MSAFAARNRVAWDRISDAYQAEHGRHLDVSELRWGGWGIPERELRLLGDVAGKDVLELGCGAAQQSLALARAGARVVGVDVSERQLEHARRLQEAAGLEFPLVHAPAHEVPLPEASFDVVFCDHGALTWADPYAVVPECARLLRPGGLLAFNMTSPLAVVCTPPGGEAGEALVRDYFGLHAIDDMEGTVSFNLPYGEWVRLLRDGGFEVEELVELRPPADASTTWEGTWVPLAWALRWPSENVWKARRRA